MNEVSATGALNGGGAVPRAQPGAIHDYELRQIVDVATSYLETGLVDDADDILQDVLEAGALTSDIRDLLLRIEQARGGTAPGETSPPHLTTKSPTLVFLTKPLAGAERLPRPVQRLIADTERDFHEGRLQSALDLCMAVTAQAPDFIPNYLRTAQVRLALGDVAGARELADTVGRLFAIDGVAEDVMLRGIHVAASPDDVGALVDYAHQLLSQPGSQSLDPFLPAAIQATQESDPDMARQLARAYAERRPTDDEAIRIYMHAMNNSQDVAEWREALATYVRPDTKRVDLLLWRAAAASLDSDTAWISWLERAVRQVRADPQSYGRARVAIEAVARFVPDQTRRLAGTVVALAADEVELAQADLDEWYRAGVEHADPLAAVIAAAARLETIERLGLSGSVPALEALIAAAADPLVADLGGTSGLLRTRVTLVDLLAEYRSAVDLHGLVDHGIEFLESLRKRRPECIAARSVLADFYIQSGRLNDGIRELRSIAKDHERAGNLTAMVEAMRKIGISVPRNLDVRGMLVDVYLRRGILDEALRELEAVASLHVDVQDGDGAISAYIRAAEIAGTIGNISRGIELYERAVGVDPDNVAVRHAAVAFHLQNGSVDRATGHLREVVRIALLDSDPDEAVASLHQIIGLAPDDVDAYHKLGEVLTSMNEYKQAERVYRRLADFAPYDPVLQAKQSALAALAATG